MCGVGPSLVTAIDPPALLYSHAVVESELRSLHCARVWGRRGRAGERCVRIACSLDDALVCSEFM